MRTCPHSKSTAGFQVALYTFSPLRPRENPKKPYKKPRPPRGASHHRPRPPRPCSASPRAAHTHHTHIHTLLFFIMHHSFFLYLASSQMKFIAHAQLLRHRCSRRTAKTSAIVCEGGRGAVCGRVRTANPRQVFKLHYTRFRPYATTQLLFLPPVPTPVFVRTRAPAAGGAS